MPWPSRGSWRPRRASLPAVNGEYVYFTGKQTVTGSEYAKFILIFREGETTAMVTANVPRAAIDAGTLTTAQVENTLATAAVKATPADAVELFRFSYLGPFKESFGLMGTSKAYSISGSPPKPGENRMIKEPTLIVSPSLDSRPIIDPKAAAERAFKALGGLKDKKVDSEQAVTIADLKGYQIIGEASDATADARVAVTLVILAGTPGGYYAMIGTSPIGEKDKFMPELDKVIMSFEPVEQKK